MSETESENVEIIRRVFESFERRNNAFAFAHYDTDIEWDTRDFKSAGVEVFDVAELYRGHEGVKRFWREWLVAWETIDSNLVELFEAGADRVAALVSQRNLGRSSGIWVDLSYAMIWTLRDGKVVRMEVKSWEYARELAAEQG